MKGKSKKAFTTTGAFVFFFQWLRAFVCGKLAAIIIVEFCGDECLVYDNYTVEYGLGDTIDEAIKDYLVSKSERAELEKILSGKVFGNTFTAPLPPEHQALINNGATHSNMEMRIVYAMQKVQSEAFNANNKEMDKNT